MAQREIPFLFMRGGTSRGPYFNAADLPSDRDADCQNPASGGWRGSSIEY